jgi:hypothetical protein
MGIEVSKIRVTYARAIVLVSAVLFLSISFYIRKFDAAAGGFDVAGLRLMGYHLARCGFTIYLAIACYSLGYWILRGLRLQLTLRGRKAFISCFFLGASTYGIAFGILGLFQLIGAPAALLATLPALLFARRPVEVLRAGRAISRFVRPIPGDKGDKAEQFVRWVTIGLAILAAVCALLFIVTRVLFIANPDLNIWEHYLHYYRDVLDRGSTLPGMLWHHFYNSKGGGLVFLADSLSDVFSVQLVSACMVVAAAIIIFDVLSDHCRDRQWPLLGLIAYFTFLFGDVADGGMFRVHALILGYAAFFFWGWQRLHSSESDARPVLVSMAVSLAYMGYYQPVASAVFAPVFVLMAVCRRLVGSRFEFKLAILFGLIIACGTAFTLLINWLLTGLLELTPMKVFWSIAQKDKVRELFGSGGIDFFLAVNNDLNNTESWLQRLNNTVHHPRLFNSVTLLVGSILAGRAILRFANKDSVEKGDLLLLEAVAFVMPLILLTIFLPSPSVERMGIYSAVFLVLGMVIVWERVIELAFGELSVVLHKPGAFETIYLPLKQIAIFVVTVLGGLMIVTTEIRSVGPYEVAIYRFARAATSLKGTMERMETASEVVSETTVKSVSDFRAASGYSGAILSLVYDTGYAYFVPARGFISEPTYALVRDPKQLLGEDAAAVAAYLRERNIKYVSLSLPNRLFTTLAFTSLFDVRRIQEFFDVAYENEGFFVLRLREETEQSTNSLPDYLLTSLELKRGGVLHFPFTADFDTALTGEDRIVRSAEEFEVLKSRFIQQLQDIMHAKMIDVVAFPASRALLNDLLTAASEVVIKADVGALLGLPQARYGNAQLNMTEDRIRERWIAIVKQELRREYRAMLGANLADLEERCDERVPFQIDRPSDAGCR